MQYLKDYEVVEKLREHTVVIFGGGNDGKNFLEKYKENLSIPFIIDNGIKKSFLNWKILPLTETLKILNGEEKIVICSRNYWNEMLSLIEKEHIKNDVFVWLPDYSQSVQRIVSFNKERWADSLNRSSTSKVLVPIEAGYMHEESVLYSYFANYLSDKYNAEINAYVRRGGTRFQTPISEMIKEVYFSFGTKQILVPTIIDSDEVARIYEKVIAGINSLEDWNDIEICGMQWGNSIIRDYLRFYELSMNPLCDARKECLYKAIVSILYWNDYFENNDVKTVILWDGVHNESYLRDIAISHNVPTYIIQHEGAQKAFLNFNFGVDYGHLKEYFDSLSLEKKEKGREWARNVIGQIIAGNDKAYAPYRGKNIGRVFCFSTKEKCVEENDKLKVIICPHIFEEDSWNRGWQVCDNDYITWFKLLGDCSQKTNYDWYIKIHPDERERGIAFINEFINEYPGIKLIPAKISPIYLKESGIRYAFTIGGSIGHEYPLLGIDVINGGNNPHISFGFNINPSDKEELKDIIMNLERYSVLDKAEQIYEYYAMMYLYYKSCDISPLIRKTFKFDEWSNFFRNENEKHFVDVVNVEMEDNIQKMMPLFFEKMDTWGKTNKMRTDEEIMKIISISN